MKIIKIGSTIVIAALLTGIGANADEDHGRGKKEREERDVREHEQRERKDDRRREFSELERQKIRIYAQNYDSHNGKHRSQLPPGLAKKLNRGKKLPPGWQARCAPGQVMPAEVYDECRPLPNDLVLQLPPAPPATVTVAIDGRIVRLAKATREILDVFDLKLPF